jgi:hypothetical protein
MGVADKLDPFQAYLPYKLYRESTRYVKGKIVKVNHFFSASSFTPTLLPSADPPTHRGPFRTCHTSTETCQR